MHDGNLAFHPGNRSAGSADHLTLAPIYDMLPMLYAPGSQGDLAEREFSPRPPVAAVADVWQEAAAAAVRFWERVEADRRISQRMRATAEVNRKKVRRCAERVG